MKLYFMYNSYSICEEYRGRCWENEHRDRTMKKGQRMQLKLWLAVNNIIIWTYFCMNEFMMEHWNMERGSRPRYVEHIHVWWIYIIDGVPRLQSKMKKKTLFALCCDVSEFILIPSSDIKQLSMVVMVNFSNYRKRITYLQFILSRM